MHAVVLLAPPGTPLCELYTYLGTSMLPVTFLVNLETHGFVQVTQAKVQQHFLINAHTMFMMMSYAVRHHGQYFYVLSFEPNCQISRLVIRYNLIQNYGQVFRVMHA